MPTMTMRLDETDAEVVRKDLATLREAIAADNGVRYTHEQVLAQLGL